MREVGQRLTALEAKAAIERVEAYRREWSDYESFDSEAHKAQRVADFLTAYIEAHQAIPASLTEEEEFALW
jgi:hypothetical protein